MSFSSLNSVRRLPPAAVRHVREQYMNIAEVLSQRQKTGFSFEVLPPLRGSHIEKLYRNIDQLREFNPLYINITSHRSELVFRDAADGTYRKVSVYNRPGSVAVAAAIQNKYGIPAVPHLICSGFTRSETEYALIELSFLGINNLLILRGDKAKHDARYTPEPGGYTHAIELEEQVHRFNEGYFMDDVRMELAKTPFCYGVAGYPEKHFEAPNPEEDLRNLKLKVDAGASYIVTQMFFDNSKYYDFVARCRAAGITVPIVPGIKPIVLCSQLTVLPNVFHVDMPDPLVGELKKCKTDAEAKEVGVAWCTQQAKDLIAHGVPSINFYSFLATDSVRRVAQAVY